MGCSLLVSNKDVPQVGVLRKYAVEWENRAARDAKYDADALFEERFANDLTSAELLGHFDLPGVFAAICVGFFPASGLRLARGSSFRSSFRRAKKNPALYPKDETCIPRYHL